MEWIGELWRRLGYLVRRRRFDAELEEELRHHLEMRAAREGGMEVARRRFGNEARVAERSRGEWGWSWLEAMGQDACYAVRQLRGAPGYTVAAVLCLAVGIGVNTTIFSLMDGMWLRPLPVEDPASVVYVSMASEGERFGALSYPEYEDIAAQSKTLAGLTVTQRRGPVLVGEGFAESTLSNVVSEDYFTVLGVGAQAGRVFTAQDGGSAPVVVMSDSLWRRRYGADPGIVGRTVRLGRLYTVIGVARKGFRGVEQWVDSDFWIPMKAWDAGVGGERAQRELRAFTALGRLRPGVAVGEARREIEGIAGNLERAYGRAGRSRRGVLMTALEYRMGSAGRLGGVLLGIAGVVLLIACANVANLQLARAGARAREIAVRMAIGAGRGRLVRQLLTESAVVGAMGVAAALLLAGWLIRLLPAVVTPPGNAWQHFQFRMDERVLGLTLAMSVLTVIAFGLWPALRMSSVEGGGTLKGAERGSRRSGRARDALVVAQVALSVVLLTAAGLLVRSFARSVSADAGFERRGVLVASVMPSGGSGQVRAAYAEMVERLRATAGVRAAALAMRPPLWSSEGGAAQRVSVAGREAAIGRGEAPVKFNVVGEGYFGVMGIRLLRGRGFGGEDREGAAAVAIVSESMARRYWPGRDAVGEFLTAEEDPAGTRRRVVGVVADARINSMTEEMEPYLYLPYGQTRREAMMLLAATSGDPLLWADPLRAVVAGVDRRAPVLELSTMGLVVRANTYDQELAAGLAASLGGVALLLAAIGLYGVIAYTTVQRTREIGIRMALGAERWDALRMVLGHGMRLAVAGVAVGLAAASVAAPVVAKLLYGVSPRDPATMAGVAAVMLAVALAASYGPAWRATKVDPLAAVRCD